MSLFKKNKLGLANKVRPLKEIDQEYGAHAALIGHNSRIIKELMDQIDERTAIMVRLAKEAELAKKAEAVAKIDKPAEDKTPPPQQGST